MFLAITLTSIILLFNFVSSIEEIDNQITAYAIQEQEESEEPEEVIIQEPEIENKKDLNKNLEGEIYTTFAWGMFYIIIIVLIALFAVLAIILKNTISKNIKNEEETRGFSKWKMRKD